MASIMRLQPHHTGYAASTNDLVKDAEELPKEEIERRVAAYQNDPSARSDAILAFSSIIRHLTCRYIGTFRGIRHMEDDLVSTGFEVVIHALDNGIEPEDCCRVISNRIIDAQAQFINDYRSAHAPSLRTQRERVKRGEEAVYAVSLTVDHDQPDADNSLQEFEFYETLINMDLTDIERAIIHPSNWGKTIHQLQEELGETYYAVQDAFKRVKELAKEVAYAD